MSRPVKVVSKYAIQVDFKQSGGYIAVEENCKGRWRKIKIGETLQPALQRCRQIRKESGKDFRLVGLIPANDKIDSIALEANIRQIFKQYGAKMVGQKTDYLYMSGSYADVVEIVATIMAQVK